MGPQCQIDVMPGVKISWYEQERHFREVVKKGAQKVETNHKMIKGIKRFLMNMHMSSLHCEHRVTFV